MPYSAPNQKMLIINRAPLDKNFLGINNDNWKYAARVLGAQAFLLYIYLASNKDGYKFALSPAAVQNEIGMPRSTFYDQLRKLESLGFIIPDKGNVLQFYEKQQSDTHTQSACVPDNSVDTNAGKTCPSPEKESPQDNIEIYVNKKDKNKQPEEQSNTVSETYSNNKDDFEF